MSIAQSQRQLGRYLLHDEIASGGMATVHFGRLVGAVGFSRVVAIKKLHAHHAHDPHFLQMFLDEARLAARVKHPNVVATNDVVQDGSEVFLVMDYVLGESLQRVLPHDGRTLVPLSVVSSIMSGVLEGLHAAHEAQSDQGTPLDIVHRDVSPHNILVGADGVTRVFDFGIAKASSNAAQTREGIIKGKVAYMAPEQVRGAVDRRADIYACGVILWELVTSRRLHAGEKNDSLFLKLAKCELTPPTPPSTLRDGCPAALDEVIHRATSMAVDERYPTAREMVLALEAAIPPASAREVGEWLRSVSSERIAAFAKTVRRIEGDSDVSDAQLLLLANASSHSSIGRHDLATGSAAALANDIAPPAKPKRNVVLPAALFALAAALLFFGVRLWTVKARDAANPISGAQLSGARIGPNEGQPEAAPPHASEPIPPPPPTLGHGSSAPTTETKPTPVAPTVLAPIERPTAPARAPAYVPPTRVAPAAAPAAPAPSAQPSSGPAKPGPRPGCESPFMIGADGIRQIKPECL